MSTVKVSVKWGKQKFDNVELDLNEKPLVFKTQLFTLTGVEPSRQKIMVKGGILKDDDDWSKYAVKEGHAFMMMGTAGELPKEPLEKAQFVEDMTDAQLAKAQKLPIGLVNLGNTCYMNATLQCLRSVPELKQSLSSFRGTPMQDPSSSVTATLRELCNSLQNQGEAVEPLAFWLTLRNVHPDFSSMQNNQPQQQDAQECWGVILRHLGQKLTPLTLAQKQVLDSTSSSQPDVANFIDQFFGGKLKTTYKNTQSVDEPEEVSTESFQSLSCHINQEVGYINIGLKLSMDGTIEKRSPLLDQNCLYTKSSRVTRLPAYLTVNMVRFQWVGQNSTKILRPVKFSMSLDVYELCAPELQERLRPMRDKFKAYDDAVALSQSSKKGKGAATSTTSNENAMDTSSDEEYESFSFENDYGSNNSGYYDLVAVLSHKGRSVNSGHYVAWTKRAPGDWLKYDDDTVSPVKEEDILKLCGGGDWHMAYLLLYAPRRLPKKFPSVEN